jgi:excinuclease ABC subunit B
MDKKALEKAIEKNKLSMEKAAKELNFKEAARLRDEMFALQELLNKK